VTCNLPETVLIPATAVAGFGQFRITRTSPLTGKGGEFVALCNATSASSPCNNLTQYKFQYTTIQRMDFNLGVSVANATVQIKMGYTLGLLPDATLNDTVLDATKGFAHTFSSRGSFVNGSNSLSGAVNNVHNAEYSFTYVLGSGTCGTATEPFNTAGCTASKRIKCKLPAPSASVICETDPADTDPRAQYTVTSTATSLNSVTPAGALQLEDPIQRTCGNLFPTIGNPTCRAVERGTGTLKYSLTRRLDKVNITASAVGASGSLPNILAVSAGENLKCFLHESGGTLNPNDKGKFQLRVFGSAEISTNSMDAATTFFGIPGNPEEDPNNPTPSPVLIAAEQIRYNNFFADPATGVIDEFPDAWVVFDAERLATLGGITCSPELAQQLNTFVMQSTADVTVSGIIQVEGKPKPNPKPSAGTPFNLLMPDRSVSCEIQAVVGPCNNP